MKTEEIVRAYFRAYETKDQEALDALLGEDFTFSSPLDDNISRAKYFARCWPMSKDVKSFEIEKLFTEGNEAFVTYQCTQTGGDTFRNTEFFKIEAAQIERVDVYFGREFHQFTKAQ
jgi:ketosteroid isomerase-like protein